MQSYICLHIYDCPTGHAAQVICLEVLNNMGSSGNHCLLSASADGSTCLWDTRRAKGLAANLTAGSTGSSSSSNTFGVCTAGVCSLAVSDDAQMAAVGRRNGRIHAWDVRKVKQRCMCCLAAVSFLSRALALAVCDRIHSKEQVPASLYCAMHGCAMLCQLLVSMCRCILVVVSHAHNSR